jgi:hypothetical protein
MLKKLNGVSIQAKVAEEMGVQTRSLARRHHKNKSDKQYIAFLAKVKEKAQSYRAKLADKAHRDSMRKATKDKGELFLEGNSKKKWLRRVLGIKSNPINIDHCWVEEEGEPSLCINRKAIIKYVDTYFYQWTKRTTVREDSVLDSQPILKEVMGQRKDPSLWCLPTEECLEGDPDF